MAGRNLIQVRNASKSYGSHPALINLDLEVGEGELLGLLGPNGAGKTTTISLLLGLERPDQGTVEMFGSSSISIQTKRQVGVMMQSASLHGSLKVREIVHLVSSYYLHPMALSRIVSIAGIEELMGRRYQGLSGGEQRRVQFAVAICGNPKLLLLDEPTVGLDIETRHKLWNALKVLANAGTSVILTSHYLEEVEALASRVVVLNQGQIIAAGDVKTLKGQFGQKQIKCRSSLTPSEIMTWPTVVEASVSDGILSISTNDIEATLRRLLERDAKLTDLDIRDMSLNDAFIKIVHGN